MSDSNFTENSSASRITKDIKNHVDDLFTKNRLTDFDEIQSDVSASTVIHRTCGALRKVYNPPRPSGGNSSSSSKSAQVIEVDSSNNYDDPFQNYFLGRVNSLDECKNRGFARVKDSCGRITNLIYLFP